MSWFDLPEEPAAGGTRPNRCTTPSSPERAATGSGPGTRAPAACALTGATRVAVTGASQGGGLALAAAGLIPCT
jgi:hypothetical protein